MGTASFLGKYSITAINTYLHWVSWLFKAFSQFCDCEISRTNIEDQLYQ
jgi:hypothetical protein